MKTSVEQRLKRVSWAAIKKVDGKAWAYPGTVSNSEEQAMRRLLNLVFAPSQQKKFNKKTLLQRLRRDGWTVGPVQVVPVKGGGSKVPKAKAKTTKATKKEAKAEPAPAAEPAAEPAKAD